MKHVSPQQHDAAPAAALLDGWRARRLLFTLPALLLSACASVRDIPPGTPLDQVTARLGPPTLVCPLADGGRRVVWSTQPAGQEAWRANVDAGGKIDRLEPALTDAAFQALQTGKWTQQDVSCEFGPPAEISSVGLPSSRQIVWSYRYRQSVVWDSLMHVYFGGDGEFVTRAHPGPDLRYEFNLPAF